VTTLSEQILGAQQGEFVDRKVDRCYVHDGTGVLTLEAWRKMGSTLGLHPSRAFVLFDHIVPANTTLTADLQAELRKFASQNRVFFSDVGGGICHQVMVEGHVFPGEVVVGADSHTCTLGAFGAFATGLGATAMAAVWTTGETWFRVPDTIGVWINGALPGPSVEAKDIALSYVSSLGTDGAANYALEFVGEGAAALGMEGRMTVANLAVETGAKTGLFPSDGKTYRYLKGYGLDGSLPQMCGWEYTKEIEVDLGDLEPLIAVPPRVDTVRPVRDLEGTPIDQVFVGTCTNGRFEDLVRFASVLRGRKVAVRTIVVPASRSVLLAASRLGVVTTLIAAGCTIGVPGCGPCLGAHMGVIGEGEACFSTANRNYRNRMGVGGEVYLGSVATAAATALSGAITSPEELYAN
jgi:methanogen homoaconitase large subunit